jgi:HemK-related putative methylase
MSEGTSSTMVTGKALQTLPPVPLVRPLAFGRVRRLAGKVAFLGNVRRIRRKYDAYALEIILDLPIVCVPGVFNPKLMRSGEFLAAYISTTDIAPEASVLDMGAGSGVCAIIAAQRARRVVAVDITSAAIRCTRANAWLNGVQDRVEVRQGDLFAPVNDEGFDVVLFNPPFYQGAPVSDLDRSWRATDVAERFAVGLQRHLRPGGYALMLLSTFGNPERFVEAMRKANLSMAVVAVRNYVNERLTVVRVQPQHNCANGALS